MNPDQPSREQIEARITALLCGELPADEAELLRWTISQDPELQKLHDQLKLTIGFVREALKNPAGAQAEKETPIKLSQDKRQKLLEHFNTERPQKLSWLKRIEILSPSSFATAAIVILMICGLVAISIPNFVKPRSTSQSNSIINNLRQIDAAKEEWALENHKSLGDVPASNDLTPYVQAMRPVAGEKYTLGKVSEPAVAEFHGERLTAMQSQAAPENQMALKAENTQSRVPKTTTPPQMAQIVLPNTESQKESELNGDAVSSQRSFDNPAAGPVANLSSGASTSSPTPPVQPPPLVATTESSGNESEPDTNVFSQNVVGYINVAMPTNAPVVEVPPASPAVTALPSEVPPASLAALPSVAASTEPNPGVSALAPPAGGYNFQPNPASNGLFGNRAQFTVKGNDFYEDGAGGGTVAFQATNGQLALSWPTKCAGWQLQNIQPNAAPDAGTVSFGSSSAPKNNFHSRYPYLPANLADALAYATNGTPYDNKYFNFPDGSVDTNLVAITKAQSLNYRRDKDSSYHEGEVNGQLNATTANGSLKGSVNSMADVTVNTARLPEPMGQGGTSGTIGSSTGLPETVVAQGGTAATTFSPQQSQEFYNGRAGVGPSQAYREAKRKLADREELHQLLSAKIDNLKAEAANPTSTLALPIEPAQPATSQNLWQRMTREVESKAQIKIEPDYVQDVNPKNGVIATYGPYDPYFMETELKSIKSDAVLGPVVDALKLDQKWGDQSDGEKLSRKDAIALLRSRLDLQADRNTKEIEIGAKSDKPDEAVKIANAVAEAYKEYRLDVHHEREAYGVKVLENQYADEERAIREMQAKLQQMAPPSAASPPPTTQANRPLIQSPAIAPIPQPEVQTRDNAFSTFSLNVSDVSFKLALASLEKGLMPRPSSIRTEEFINALDYHDPEPLQGQPLAFASERARNPFEHERDFLRFSVKAGAAGRQAGRPLNLVLLLDTSGSMERADRVAIIREALRVLAAQLQPQDTVSVVTFARTARLWADGVPGDQAGATLDKVGSITPEGGTNLEEAMRLAYETALRHFLAHGMNRVVLLTDGAANLGNVDPQALTQKVEAERRQGIALDCFGIGWEDYNDDLLEQLSSNGDGRYAFLNSPEEAATEFAAKLAGALQVAAEDVKVQVEFNPNRVTTWRQIGYAKHQLTKEQFRDNSVAAGAISAREAGNALYVIETNPDGQGPIATVRVRYRVPGTQENYERSWLVDYTGAAPALAQSSAAMRLAVSAAEFSEWLAGSSFAQEVTPDELLKYLSGVPQFFSADDSPKQLQSMILQAKSVSGK